MKVRIESSPYHSVKRGEVGVVVADKYVGTSYHVYEVEFKDGPSSLFYADELKALGVV